MRFSIVVPTFNRHDLLREALESIRYQTFADWEAIVVDDGSNPAVTIEQVEAAAGPAARLIRHESRQGLPAVNNTGLARSSGDIVIYLDDDDLLEPRALEELDALFRAHSEIDCLFMNVRAFGDHAEGTNANQAKALQKLLAAVSVDEKDDLWILGPETFDALLDSIPVAFQRPAATRRAWSIVGGFNEETVFSKSEWAVRASAQCRLGLTRNALQLWRVDNQNYFSRPEKYLLGLNARLQTLHAILRRFDRPPERDTDRARKVKRRLGDAYFDKAWTVRMREGRTDWRSLVRSFQFHPGWRVFRFVLRGVALRVASSSKWGRHRHRDHPP